MEYVTTPTYGWLRQMCSGCTTRFVASSPYIGSLLVELIDGLAPGVRKSLVTRVDLRDFAVGASDVEALCELASRNTTILSLPRLHAKVYVIDKQWALVTSANASDGGMRRNWECGVALQNPRQVNRIARLVLAGFGSRRLPQVWRAEELNMLRGPVRELRKQMPRVKYLPELDVGQLPAIKLSRKTRAILMSGLAGWTKLALEGVMSQVDDVFELDQLVSRCVPRAAEAYPRNRHVRPQIRKQLQRLRDLGLVEFLGGGTYRRTILS
jgi:hypothetical protein